MPDVLGDRSLKTNEDKPQFTAYLEIALAFD